MKKTILLPIVFLLLFVATTFSQEYHPFLNNSSWIINDWVSCCRPTEVKIVHQGTDVVIDDITYTKFTDPFESNLSNFTYLREDVAAKKVYKIVNGVDALLYDFNLETGDVIVQYGNTFTATVDYISLNDGTTRKRIKLVSAEQYCNQNRKQTWIEGVGSDSHPFYPYNNGFIVCSAGGGWRVYTKCSFQIGDHIYGEPNCPDLRETMLGVNDAETVSSEISFSPNPFTTELTIQSDGAFSDATIMLYNVMGQLVSISTKQSGNKLIINRDQLSSGLYFIQLYEKEKLVKTSKIMVN